MYIYKYENIYSPFNGRSNDINQDCTQQRFRTVKNAHSQDCAYSRLRIAKFAQRATIGTGTSH